MSNPAAGRNDIAQGLQRILLASRWLLIVFFAVMMLALAAFAVLFVVHAVQLAPKLASMEESEQVLTLLGFVDATLIASLVVMVILSGYDNFVAPMQNPGTGLPWLGSLDAGGLKIKIATSIVTISSIELLGMVFDIEHQSAGSIAGAIALQAALVVTGLVLGIMEKLASH